MGTLVEITVRELDADKAQSAISSAFDGFGDDGAGDHSSCGQAVFRIEDVMITRVVLHKIFLIIARCGHGFTRQHERGG